MNRKPWVVLVMGWMLVLVGGLVFAQETGRLEGRITRQDGAPLGGVSVRIDQLDQVALTDEGGVYSFPSVPAGAYTLTFSLADNKATQEGVQVTAGAKQTVDKVLDWDVSFADTITVTSVSRRQERITEAPAAVNVVPQEDIEQKASSGQVPKLLEFSPGVDFTQSGLYDFNFNTRGFNSSLNRRILTLIDGRDPSVPFLGSQEWAALSFPMDELASVELVRGPGSALYGANAFSGVLNMTTKAPRGSEGGQIRVSAGELATRRGDFRWATGLPSDWYFKIVGGYQQSHDFTLSRNKTVEYSTFCASASQTNCLRREAVPLALTEDKIGFGGLRLDKYFEDGGALTLEGGTADLEGPTFLTGIGRVQTTDVQRPWYRLNYNLPHWNVLAYYDQRKAKNQIALASGGKLFEDSSNLHGEVQGNTGFSGGKGFLVGGLSYNQQKVDTANPAGIQTLMKTGAHDEHQEAVFGQVEYTLTDKLKGVVAGRVDKSTLHDTEFSPKASLVYSLAPSQSVRLTYNQAFQVPNYSEYFLRVVAAPPITGFSKLEDALAPLLGGKTLGLRSIPVIALGNENLDVEKVKSYELGYSGVLAGKAFVTVDYYQSKINNFVTDLLPGVNPAYTGYAPPTFLPAPVAAQVLATLRAGLGPNFGGLTYINGQPTVVFSYANAGKVDTQGVDVGLNYYANDHWLVDFSYSWFDFKVKEKALGDQLLPNAPENKLSAGLTYTGDRFGTSVKYRWVDGFPWAAGVFVGEVPSYGVVDLGLSYKVNSNFSFGVDVSNLLDKEHYQSFGGDLLQRRALGNVTFSW
jgi:iron complex outermembrane receptor protein